MALVVSSTPQLWKPASKTVTLTGASGLGLNGSNVVWFTVAGGLVVIREIAGRCTTSLTSAGGGTLTLGTLSQTAVFIAATTGTALTTTNNVWATTTPTAGAIALAAADKEIAISENVISLVGTANITAGVVEMNCLWFPLTPGATLV